MGEKNEKTAFTGKLSEYWDKVKDSRLFAAAVRLIGSLIAAIILYAGTVFVAQRNEKARTYELLSSREVAAHTLQAQVFETYAQYVVPELAKKGNDHTKVALLAGLHSNFSEFFDTRAVFETFAETIKDPIARHELRRLAERVARHQGEFIKAHGDPANKDTMFATLTLSPGDSVRNVNLGDHKVLVRLIGDPRRHYTLKDAQDAIGKRPTLGDTGDDLIDDVSDYASVEVTLRWKSGMQMGPFTFEVSYMDTPYMDNMWMRHSDGSHHQLALRLVDIDTHNEEHKVEIELLHFPGNVYAATQRLPISELLDGGHKQKRSPLKSMAIIIGLLFTTIYGGLWVFRVSTQNRRSQK